MATCFFTLHVCVSPQVPVQITHGGLIPFPPLDFSLLPWWWGNAEFFEVTVHKQFPHRSGTPSAYTDTPVDRKPTGVISGVLQRALVPQSYMSQCREKFTESKVIDKKWFIKIGCLWGLQVNGWETAHPEVLVVYSFIIKGKGEDLLFLE